MPFCSGTEKQKTTENLDFTGFFSRFPIYAYCKKCRRPESNRYGYHYPRDFKSRASASSATAARDAQTVFAKSIRALHCLFNLASMGGGGFEPPKQIAADLQSVPFGHSGIHPFCLSTISIYIINKRKAQGNLSNSPALFPNFYTQNDHAAFI